MELTSRENPFVKECIKLLSDAKARRKSGRFVVEGARLCEDAARSGVVIDTVLATPSAAVKYADRFDAIAACARRTVMMSDAVAKALSDTGSPQGIVCLCAMPASSTWSCRPDGRYVALENLQDPGNLGTVIRTAEALGIDGILLSSGCCDLYNPKVLRASMGGVFRLPLRTVDDFCAELRALGGQTAVLACVVDRDAAPITGVDFDGAVAVIGNEGNGLTADAVAACTHRITIPMAGRAESLNASMAAGILMWELCRQRGGEE